MSRHCHCQYIFSNAVNYIYLSRNVMHLAATYVVVDLLSLVPAER